MNALVDLYWARDKEKRGFRCSVCPEKQKKVRKCESKGYDHSKRGYSVDAYSLKYTFCPGKATQSDMMASLFKQCKTAYLLKEFPVEGRVDEQPEMFYRVYESFVERWEQRKYSRVWTDVFDVLPKVMEQLGKIITAPFRSK